MSDRQRSYAFIETESNEFEQIIDLLRKFFPRTKILESNHPTWTSQISTPIFRGKVKDYLQRRYLDESQFLIPKPNSTSPYSISSDPGSFRSPWFNTPTSTFHFQFPQDQQSVNARSSISQLSTLTKMLCDEPNLHTPITPRYLSTHRCPHCSYVADQRDLITQHLRIHHGKQRSKRKNATSTFQ